jgi:hypothetical protein
MDSQYSPLAVPISVTQGMLGGISRTAVYELIRHGQLTKIRIGKRALVTTGSISALVDRLARAQVTDCDLLKGLGASDDALDIYGNDTRRRATVGAKLPHEQRANMGLNGAPPNDAPPGEASADRGGMAGDLHDRVRAV